MKCTVFVFLSFHFNLFVLCNICLSRGRESKCFSDGLSEHTGYLFPMRFTCQLRACAIYCLCTEYHKTSILVLWKSINSCTTNQEPKIFVCECACLKSANLDGIGGNLDLVQLPHCTVTVNEVRRSQLMEGFHILSSVGKLSVQLVFGQVHCQCLLPCKWQKEMELYKHVF